jgi:hypothetical protein
MEFKLPTETIQLPSKGLLYSTDNPLSSGEIEIKYMTAKEEDILTNANYINNGTVLDKLMKSLIVSDINYNDLLIGDKNAIMIAARILGYGKDYKFTYQGENHTVDLSTLENKNLDESLFTRGNNRFSFTLPATKVNIEFKLLTHGDEVAISQEIKGLKKINSESTADLTTRLKHMILSIDGSEEKADVRKFVDNYLLAQDARALRNYINEIQPDVDLTFFRGRTEEKTAIPIGLSFFWPDI